ncbi:hypothetical protein CC1G_12821 [Coprinopsis cinerea okayama7|uniref:Uncharacterized protein n=1 Tax=Coprinopsis cinerea (strain Okayama-7 / 130 / ATCC MYA-4618 / FGSC 9003) TaxID=240176 RepID=A8PD76_COPC7|nr:hypothetical protein CC1G_12821 [Coprinopsis cinerea okayama7\|eukprot:XP_001840548.2 hypothetical protein CC1G_12821 [Coprinopsis cinerea okayama7\
MSPGGLYILKAYWKSEIRLFKLIHRRSAVNPAVGCICGEHSRPKTGRLSRSLSLLGSNLMSCFCFPIGTSLVITEEGSPRLPESETDGNSETSLEGLVDKYSNTTQVVPYRHPTPSSPVSCGLPSRRTSPSRANMESPPPPFMDFERYGLDLSLVPEVLDGYTKFFLPGSIAQLPNTEPVLEGFSPQVAQSSRFQATPDGRVTQRSTSRGSGYNVAANHTPFATPSTPRSQLSIPVTLGGQSRFNTLPPAYTFRGNYGGDSTSFHHSNAPPPQPIPAQAQPIPVAIDYNQLTRAVLSLEVEKELKQVAQTAAHKAVEEVTHRCVQEYMSAGSSSQSSSSERDRWFSRKKSKKAKQGAGDRPHIIPFNIYQDFVPSTVDARYNSHSIGHVPSARCPLCLSGICRICQVPCGYEGGCDLCDQRLYRRIKAQCQSHGN